MPEVAPFGSPQAFLDSVRAEDAWLDQLLVKTGVTATPLRHALRTAIGTGTTPHKGGPVGRSAPLKAAFARAAELANDARLDCLWLLAALMEAKDTAIEQALTSAGCDASLLAKEAFAAAKRRTAADPTQALLALEPFLRERLVGQDDAIKRIATRIRLAQSGPRKGPPAVLLLIGPSGVGKTEIARHLAEFLSGGGTELIRIDMSAHAEDNSLARLTDDKGELISRLRSKPNAIVLLDEVDKAHPQVLDVFLKAFDDGLLTDARGRTTDAHQAIFVLTSHVGALRPELLTRIDEQVQFRPLDVMDAANILKQRLARLAESVLAKTGARLRTTPEAGQFILETGFAPARGAHGIAQSLERLAEAPVNSLMQAGKLKPGTAWVLIYDEGGVYALPDS